MDNALNAPDEFYAEATLAIIAQDKGKLLLMAEEADDYSWKIEGWKIIGEALFLLDEFEAGWNIWQRIHEGNPNDQRAKDLLGRVHYAKNLIEPGAKTHFLLFTGHMIDKPGRSTPRFPPERENAVKEMIAFAIAAQNKKIARPLEGIAGGACGGDILFHEACKDAGVISKMYLAFPKEKFIEASVSFAGEQWVNRFNTLTTQIETPILQPAKDLPDWLTLKDDYNIWTRNNLWMLNAAMINGGHSFSLIALWDGKPADGKGGTEHMVNISRENGAEVIIIGP